MNAFASFVRKECIHILRDPRTMLIVLLMPVVLMMLFGFAISTEIKNIDVAAVATRYTTDVRRDLTALEHNPYVTFKGIIREGEVDAALRSGRCSAVVLFGRDGKRHIVLDASNSSLSASAAIYLRSILTADAAASALPVTTYMRHNPQLKSAYNFVPGVMGLIFILICALMTCVSVVREKESGTMEVLLVSPVRPVYVVLAKMIPYLALSLFNLATILLLSHYVLEMPVAGNLSVLLILCTLYIVLSLFLGLFVSTLAQSQMVALLICAMVMLVPMMMLSGMMFPVENLPPVLKQLTFIVPARWFNDAIRKVMVEGLGFVTIWKELSILFAMALALFVASIKKFKDRLE